MQTIVYKTTQRRQSSSSGCRLHQSIFDWKSMHIRSIGLLLFITSTTVICISKAHSIEITQASFPNWRTSDDQSLERPRAYHGDGLHDADGVDDNEFQPVSVDRKSANFLRYMMKRAASDYSTSKRRIILSKNPPTTTTGPTTKTRQETTTPVMIAETIEKDDNNDDDEKEDNRKIKSIKKTGEKTSSPHDDEDNEEPAEIEEVKQMKEAKRNPENDSDDYVMDDEYVKKESMNKKTQNKNVIEELDKSRSGTTSKPRKQGQKQSSTSRSQKPSAQGKQRFQQANKTSLVRDGPKRKLAKTIEKDIDAESGDEPEQSWRTTSRTSSVRNSNNKYDEEEEEERRVLGKAELDEEKDTDEGNQKQKVNTENSGNSNLAQSTYNDSNNEGSFEKNSSAKSYPTKNITSLALVKLPFIKPKNESACTPQAYLEFPSDLIGNKWRSRGLVVIHIAVVCYMFYSLALVCEKYFMPSLEEFSQRLNLSPDVAGATLMSAGSSAPELFTAILGVFIAKGDVGTGAIVGSAVFNILFVIGLCSFVCTSPTQLNWWPVLRDSVYYCITVLVLILFIYDERVTAFESFIMIGLYGVYILIMSYNDYIRVLITNILLSNPNTAKLINVAGSSTNINSSIDDVFNSTSEVDSTSFTIVNPNKTIEDDSMFLAACLMIIRHKRLFRSQLRFRAAAHYIIIKRQHRIQQAARRQQQKQHFQNKQLKSQQSQQQKQSDEVNYFGPENEPLAADKALAHKQRIEAYANSSSISKNKFSIVSRDDYEFWNRPPEEGENYYLWLAKIPVNYVLHYTIPDCVLFPDKYIISFFMSIFWTAFFSYINVWMVTLIGYTFGIPDSVMGFTFLAAGTSVPDCYSSIHAARHGMADMAVSNSIGSNVFDILIGLAVPWFIQSAIYPGVTATINSRGIVYSVILLFLSLIVTIYLMNKYEWTLKPRLGLALLIAYTLFIALTCMLEFNLFGFVNPPPCL